MKIFARLMKVDEARREVWGRAIAEEVDKSGEIFDYAGSKPYFEAWSKSFADATDGKSLGNLRAMHGKVAAGKLIAMNCDDAAKAIDIGTKIVDDAEWQKVIEGVYTGYSIGGAYVGDKKAEKVGDAEVKRYVANPSEISLVDNPCVPSALFFDVVKADGVVQQVPFKVVASGDDSASATGDAAADAAIAKTDGESGDAAKAETAKAEGGEKADEALDVTGTPDQVEEFAKTLNESGLTMADALAALQADIAKRNAPAPVAEPVPAAGVAVDKGMWNVQAFADCLQCLANVAMSAQADADYEGDASPVPEALRAWMSEGVKIFQAMSNEESNELVASLVASTDAGEAVALFHTVHASRAMLKAMPAPDATLGVLLKSAADAMTADEFADAVKLDAPALRARLLEKAGARHSAADKAHLQNAHNSMVALGASCGDGGSEKVVANAELVKGATLAAQIETLTAKITKLEAQPVSRIRLRPVEKTDDTGNGGEPKTLSAEDIAALTVLNPDGSINEAATVTKVIQSTGGMPGDPRRRVAK
jgi:hypothetical protein